MHKRKYTQAQSWSSKMWKGEIARGKDLDRHKTFAYNAWGMTGRVGKLVANRRIWTDKEKKKVSDVMIWVLFLHKTFPYYGILWIICMPIFSCFVWFLKSSSCNSRNRPDQRFEIVRGWIFGCFLPIFDLKKTISTISFGIGTPQRSNFRKSSTHSKTYIRLFSSTSWVDWCKHFRIRLIF